MKVLHEEKDRTIIRLKDGTVVTVFEDAIQAKQIPGRRKTEKKYVELKDMYIVNDMFAAVFPKCECNERVKATC